MFTRRIKEMSMNIFPIGGDVLYISREDVKHFLRKEGDFFFGKFRSAYIIPVNNF